MKVEDISNGYFKGPKCDSLNNYEDDNAYYDSDGDYDYEENSGDSEENIDYSNYDYSNGFDEESRSPRDINSFKQELLNALNSLS